MSLHMLLLGLAGRVPDDGLAVMRTSLADGDLDDLAELLVAAARTGKLALSTQEKALIRATAAEAGVHTTGLDTPGPDTTGPDPAGPGTAGPDRPTRHRFAPDEAATLDADQAAVGAADRVGGLTALWRVLRTTGGGGVRVWLGEAEPDADVVELVAELQHSLAEAGQDPPRVEVFARGEALPAYHNYALGQARLVWARNPEPRLARVFDGVDAAGGPVFAPDRPRARGQRRQLLLDYLWAGELVLTTPGLMVDVFDGSPTVPLSFRSDGIWVWTDAVAYYLDRHHVAPAPELTEHILSAAGPPAALGRAGRHQALVVLEGTT